MGRNKIKIKTIENERQKTVTFTRRRVGLIKKAHELSVLCDCKVALLIFDSRDTCHLYSSVQPVENLLRKYSEKSFSNASSKDITLSVDDAIHEYKVSVNGEGSEDISVQNANAPSPVEPPRKRPQKQQQQQQQQQQHQQHLHQMPTVMDAHFPGYPAMYPTPMDFSGGIHPATLQSASMPPMAFTYDPSAIYGSSMPDFSFSMPIVDPTLPPIHLADYQTEEKPEFVAPKMTEVAAPVFNRQQSFLLRASSTTTQSSHTDSLVPPSQVLTMDSSLGDSMRFDFGHSMGGGFSMSGFMGGSQADLPRHKQAGTGDDTATSNGAIF